MKKIIGVLFSVFDINKVTNFFCNVLEFKKIRQQQLSGQHIDQLFKLENCRADFVTLQLGDDRIFLIEFLSHKGNPYPEHLNSHDHHFQHIAIVVSSMSEAHEKLKQNRVKLISEGAQTIPEWNQAAGGIQACYFRSPNGHPLELIYFPPDKGHERWQQNNQQLLLGIDHTAITIADTETSLQFYRDLLGFKVMGESINYGVEQERLSGVVGAKVKISGLQHKDTQAIGLEFLHYLNPLDGKPISSPLKPNDLASTYTVIEVDDFSNLMKTLEEKKIPIQALGSLPFGSSNELQRTLCLRDPDGHPILFVEVKT